MKGSGVKRQCVINGWVLTDHALQRGIERKIHANKVESTLKAPKRKVSGGRRNVMVLTGEASVVVNTVDRVVLTIY